MVFKNLMRNIVLKWQYRKAVQPVFSLSSIFQSPGRIVILYPSVSSNRQHADAVLRELLELYGDTIFCLVSSRDADLAQFGEHENADRLVPGTTEMTWYGLPAKAFIEKIKMQKSQMLIDLSTGKDYFNAYIAACSQVPVRIGNFGSWGPPVYNLEIKTNYLQSEQLILKSILDVLKSFKAGINN